MKKVRDYLNEVLGMKFNEVWLSFERKVQMQRTDFRGSSLNLEAFARDSPNFLLEIFKKLKFLKNFVTGDHSLEHSQKGQK